MAGLGAMVPNTREGGQFSLIMNMPPDIGVSCIERIRY